VLPITRSNGSGTFVGSDRVAAAVGIHRALIARIGDDVPPFVTGRDGDGPSRGTGHLAIQLGPDPQGDGQVVLLGLPVGVSEADRRRLSEAVRAPFRAGARVDRGKTVWFTVEPPSRRVEANRFWRTPARLMRTVVPFVVEVNGGPRRQTWTLDDATVCSVGFAMRSLLEPTPLGWGAGWAFRTELVRTLRDDYGVDARATRFRGPSSRLAYKTRAGELIVAAHAIVDLGRLAGGESAGFLALGRTRHLGGGLLLPLETAA
jgi:CRISPR-associated protein Csb2